MQETKYFQKRNKIHSREFEEKRAIEPKEGARVAHRANASHPRGQALGRTNWVCGAHRSPPADFFRQYSLSRPEIPEEFFLIFYGAETTASYVLLPGGLSAGGRSRLRRGGIFIIDVTNSFSITTIMFPPSICE